MKSFKAKIESVYVNKNVLCHTNSSILLFFYEVLEACDTDEQRQVVREMINCIKTLQPSINEPTN